MSDLAAVELSECEYCGRPTDDGVKLFATRHNGFVCETCNENKLWKY
jgi:recombinational DNA repair protein (RecF pathway)